MDEFHSSGAMVSAPEYDMLLHVMVDSRLKSDGWVIGTRAYGDIIYSRTETVQVVYIKTVCNCKAEEGGSDKSILHSYSTLDAWGGDCCHQGVHMQCGRDG